MPLNTSSVPSIGIGGLQSATTLDGTEIVPVVQGGSTVRTTVTLIRAGSGGGGTTNNPTFTGVVTAPAINAPGPSGTGLNLGSLAGTQLQISDNGVFQMQYNGAITPPNGSFTSFQMFASYINSPQGGTVAGQAHSQLEVHSYNGVQITTVDNIALDLPLVSTAVNWLQVLQSPTGQPVTIQPQGSDANVPLSLKGKGSGAVAITGLSTFTDTSSNNATVTVTNTANTNGSNIKLTGNGATTPSKTLSVNNGQFQIVNSAYTNGILSLSDAGNLSVTGTMTALEPVRTITAGPVTVAAADRLIFVKLTTPAAITVTLEASPVVGTRHTIKRGTSATDNITITPATGTIDGAANLVISTAYGRAAVVYTGTEWSVVG